MKFCFVCHKLFLFRLPLNLSHIITQQIRLNGFSLLGKRNEFGREMSMKKKEKAREGKRERKSEKNREKEGKREEERVN